MEITFKNQALEADVNVKGEEWVLLYHTDEDGKKVNDLSMSKGNFHIKITGEGSIKTGSLKAVSILKALRAKSKLNRALAKRVIREICREEVAE